MTCVVIGTGIVGCSGAPDPLHQRVYDFVPFGQGTSLAGSIWTANLLDVVELEQSYHDFYSESVLTNVNFSQEAVAVKDLFESVSHNLLLFELNTFSGGRLVEDLLFKKSKSGFILEQGFAVFVSSFPDEVGLAVANTIRDEAKVAGIVFRGGDAGDEIIFQTQGIIQLDNWFDITGTNLLIPGAYYYLSDSIPGNLQVIPTTTEGNFVTLVGQALSITALNIELEQPIEL